MLINKCNNIFMQFSLPRASQMAIISAGLKCSHHKLPGRRASCPSSLPASVRRDANCSWPLPPKPPFQRDFSSPHIGVLGQGCKQAAAMESLLKSTASQCSCTSRRYSTSTLGKSASAEIISASSFSAAIPFSKFVKLAKRRAAPRANCRGVIAMVFRNWIEHYEKSTVLGHAS